MVKGRNNAPLLWFDILDCLMRRQLVVELGIVLNGCQHFGGKAGWVAALTLPAFNGIHTGAECMR